MRALAFSLLFAACGEPVKYEEPIDTDTREDTDTPGDTDTDTANDTDTAPVDTDTHAPVTGTLTFIDLDSGAPVGDARSSLTAAGHEYDGSGVIEVEVPGAAATSGDVYATGYTDAIVTLHADHESGWSATVPLWSDTILYAIGRAHDAAPAAGFGSAVVSVLTPDGAGGWATAVGAEVTGSPAAVATLTRGERGYEESAKLGAGDREYVIFLNIPVGTFQVSVTGPDGATCTTFPSASRVTAELSIADRNVSHLLVVCQ
jgi:hypothetical protein